MRELVGQVRELIEQEYGDVWVEGEISNYRPAPSGHVYFTLKDADAQLPVVLFRRQAMLLRFRPEDGLHVLVRGRVSVYEQRGQMQLVAETMEPVGAGSLQLAFEQLRNASRPRASLTPRASARCLLSRAPSASSPRPPAPSSATFSTSLPAATPASTSCSIPSPCRATQAPAEIESAIADLNAAPAGRSDRPRPRRRLA